MLAIINSKTAIFMKILNDKGLYKLSILAVLYFYKIEFIITGIQIVRYDFDYIARVPVAQDRF